MLPDPFPAYQVVKYAHGKLPANISGWFGFGPPMLAITGAQAHGGASSLLATGRTLYEEGPAAGIELYLDDVTWREAL
jgi:hypothetical protein